MDDFTTPRGIRGVAAICLAFLLALALSACGGGGGDAPPTLRPPNISAQPSSASSVSGASATFSVTATGDALVYQWQRSTDANATAWTNIAGATGASYVIPAVDTTLNGIQFRATISNTAATVTTSAVTLTVLPAAALTGTVASGGAWADASVAITNSAGTPPCQESAIRTNALGVYLCSLRAGERAPFFVVAFDQAGGSPPLVSVGTVTPAAGSSLTLNVTPLTSAIIARMADDGRALSVVAARAIDAAVLRQATLNIVAQLANVLSSLGLDSGFDPFGSALVAATADSAGNAADQLLDIVRVVQDPASASLALSTVDNPTPVPLASATTQGAVLAAPDASATGLAPGSLLFVQALNNCFALPVAQRVLSADAGIAPAQGGPAVTAMAPACQASTSRRAGGGGVDFLQNGYSDGQFLYTLLTSDSMTGARFLPPVVLALYPKASTASGLDEVVLSFRFLDASGNPGNFIATARNLPASATATHASNWWLTGDQEPVDINIKPLIRRVEQFKTNSSNFSRYQSSLQFLVNAKGPGSVNASGSMSYARITGPGLPPNGLVLGAPVAAEVGQNFMDILNASGTIAGSTQCFNCPNYHLAQTAGLTGTAATTLAPNFSGLTWAPSGTDLSRVTRGQRYRIELFHGSSTTPSAVYMRALLTDLVPPTQGRLLAWNTLGPAAQGLLDPGNAALSAAQSTLALDWLQNPGAEQIRSINVSISTTGTLATAVPVPRGAVSISITPPSSMPALTTTTTRSLLFHYRTWDNTDKNSSFTYN